MNINQYEYRECHMCTGKPGCPTLCDACLHNRDIVAKLKQEILVQQRAIHIIEEVLKSTKER